MTTKKETLLSISICLLLLWNVIYRILVFLQFSTDFTDSDQVIMWTGVREFARGQFHEPAYFGQSYNSMMEALLASIFQNKISPSRILPLITSILALVPYMIVATICYIRKLKLQALIILALPLLFPPEYDFITSMPRGFVTGIFFAVLGSLVIYYPANKRNIFLFFFLNIIGLTLNPNAILITIPCGLFLLSLHYKKREFYIYSLFGTVIASIFPLYIWYFYEKHPLYIVHGLGEFEFTGENFQRGFSMMDKIFEYLTPLVWYQPIAFFLMILIPAVVLFLQMEKIKGFIVAGLAVIIVATLSVNKIYDADGTMFLPYSRMYLATPLAIVMFIPFIKINKWKLVLISTAVIATSSFAFKLSVLEDTITYVTDDARNGILTVAGVTDIKNDCGRLKGLSEQYGVDLILIADYDQGDSFINYGCPACEEDLPPTLSPKNERRTWRLMEEKDKINNTILIIDDTPKTKTNALASKDPVMDVVQLEGSRFLLKNNTLPTLELITKLGIKIRPFEQLN